MNPRVKSLTLAQRDEVLNEDGEVVAHQWYAERLDLRVLYRTSDLDLVLWVDPISTMREVGVALVDESGTMRANTRRDRRLKYE